MAYTVNIKMVATNQYILIRIGFQVSSCMFPSCDLTNQLISNLLGLQ